MARELACRILQRIAEDQAYSHIILSHELNQTTLDDRDKALVTELVYGTLTWQKSLDSILAKYVRKGLHTLDLPVLIALRVGLYQIIYLDRIPTHAAVDEAVTIVKKHVSKGASGLVNGVLRTIIRERPSLDISWDANFRNSKPERYIAQRYSLPNWIATHLIERYGISCATEIAQAFTQRPPIYLRASQPDESLELIDALAIEDIPDIPNAYKVNTLPPTIRQAIEQNAFVVQDIGSQLIGYFCGVEAGMTVLDGCAGLGGKTLQLASFLTPSGVIDAVEPNAGKIQKLRDTITALSLEQTVNLVQSTLQEHAATGTRNYQCVLIDAPCSGLGVLRRHPEMRWTRKRNDIASLVAIQKELLNIGADLIQPGGTLVYSVCTFTKEEGPEQIDQFLMDHPEFYVDAPAQHSPIDWYPYLDANNYLVLDPATHDSDAFFAARLKRK